MDVCPESLGVMLESLTWHIAFRNIPVIIPLPNLGAIRIILRVLHSTHFFETTDLHKPLPNSQFFLRVRSHPISARKQNVLN